jgi:hypothetical protein
MELQQNFKIKYMKAAFLQATISGKNMCREMERIWR